VKTYFEMLRDPRWQKKRLEIMGRDHFKCRLCGDGETTLNVHHLSYEKGAAPWDYPDAFLITACQPCHEEMHALKVGDRIVQALIDGGASLVDLYGVMSTFQGLFNDGPNPKAIASQDWGCFPAAVTAVLSLVRDGISAKQIQEALKQLEVSDGQDSHN